jgi:hypothetical protein
VHASSTLNKDQARCKVRLIDLWQFSASPRLRGEILFPLFEKIFLPGNVE